MQYIEISSGRILSVDDVMSFGISQNNEAAQRAAGLCPVVEVSPDTSDMDCTLYTILPSDDIQCREGRYERVWNRTPLPLPIARAGMKARIAARRYEAEMGGVNWTDAAGTIFRLATDVESRTRLQTALDGCPEDGTIQYKLDGEFRAMTSADLTVLRDAVAVHVQACFAREAEIFAEIDAAESVEALANIKWPEEQPDPHPEA